MRACWCTNQCPGCGACCQIDCGCRRTAHGWKVSPSTTTTPIPPAVIVNPSGLTEEQVRQIIREELERAK